MFRYLKRKFIEWVVREFKIQELAHRRELQNKDKQIALYKDREKEFENKIKEMVEEKERILDNGVNRLMQDLLHQSSMRDKMKQYEKEIAVLNERLFFYTNISEIEKRLGSQKERDGGEK